MEWENGASGVFISSTGDAPGINRLEISLEEAMIVCEKGEIRIGELKQELGTTEAEYKKTSTDYFRKIKGTWKCEQPEKEEAPYRVVIQAFSDACHGTGSLVADGREGLDSLLVANAAYLSSWEKRMVKIPERNTEEEKIFEESFEKHLSEKKKIVSMKSF